MKDAFKTLFLIAVLAVWTNAVFFSRPAQALNVTAGVKATSSFKGPNNENVYVASWIEDGVKCTALTSGSVDGHKNMSLALSCVKL